MTELLLDRGADANMVDRHGMTPLHWASLYAHKNIVQLLLERGADPNRVDMLSRSPLDLAHNHGDEQITKLINGHA